MEIHFQIKFQKNCFDKELSWLDHYLLSDKVTSLLKYKNFIGIKKFNLRRGNLEILFVPKFKKKFLQSVMIIVSYQWHNKVSNPLESIDNSYFIAGFVLLRHWRISQ